MSRRFLVVGLQQNDRSFVSKVAFRLALPYAFALVFILQIAGQIEDLPNLRSLANGFVSQELSGGLTHSYPIKLGAGEFLFITVEQKGIDVAVTLLESEGKEVVGTNAANGASGLEVLCFVIERAGDYRVEINATNRTGPAGRYEMKVQPIKTADPLDRLKLASYESLAEAGRLLERSDPTDLPRVLELNGKVLEQFRSSDDGIGQAFALRAIGAAMVASGERRQALDYFSRSLALWQNMKISSEIASTHNWISGTSIRLGHFQEVLDHAQAALPIYVSNGDRAGETEILMLLGNFYLSLGETASAMDHYAKVERNWRALGNMHRVAGTLNAMGQASASDERKSFEYFAESLRTYRADRPGTRGEANTLNQLGFHFLRTGDLANATKYFDEAMPIWKRITDAFGEPVTLLGLAQISERKGDLEKALELMGESFSLARRRGVRSVETAALFSIARLERKRNNLVAAKLKIEEAIGIVESTRAGILSEEFRSAYFAQTQDLYDLYIDLLMTMHQASPSAGFDAMALQASERARARGLTELLVEANADIRQGIEPALLDEEKGLQQKINAAEQSRYQMILQKRPQSQIDVADANVRSFLNEYKLIQAKIRASSPRYAALTQPQAISLEQIQAQILDPDTLILEYWLGKDRSFLWVVSDKDLKSFVLLNRHETETAARSLYEKLKNESRSPEIVVAAENLSRMILAPATAGLAKKRLLIVADGMLQYIPFAALSSRAGRYLIEDHELVTLPSAMALAAMRSESANRTRPAKTIAVFADPVFSSADLRIKADVAVKSSRPSSDSTQLPPNSSLPDERPPTNLPRLPGSRREAQAILALTTPAKSKRALDFDANRNAILVDELSQYQYIHFATHGLLNSQQPELSGIVFSLFDPNGRPQNGFLRLHEIYNLKLPVELVALSSCETGLGRNIRGEGIIGLTRGFMYAGARRVAVSLWRVDDQATSELMQRFYRELLKDGGPSPAAALRTSQISMLREKRWNSPFYWSAFVLQGEWK